jgi:hypothetical protein
MSASLQTAEGRLVLRGELDVTIGCLSVCVCHQRDGRSDDGDNSARLVHRFRFSREFAAREAHKNYNLFVRTTRQRAQRDLEVRAPIRAIRQVDASGTCVVRFAPSYRAPPALRVVAGSRASVHFQHAFASPEGGEAPELTFVCRGNARLVLDAPLPAALLRLEATGRSQLATRSSRYRHAPHEVSAADWPARVHLKQLGRQVALSCRDGSMFSTSAVHNPLQALLEQQARQSGTRARQGLFELQGHPSSRKQLVYAPLARQSNEDAGSTAVRTAAQKRSRPEAASEGKDGRAQQDNNRAGAPPTKRQRASGKRRQSTAPASTTSGTAYAI